MPSDNPFHFGTPVPVDEQAFTGRTEEIRVLAALVRSHASAVLLSPRRYGKTSILLRAEREILTERAALVRTNAFASPSASKFASSLTSGLYRVSDLKQRGRGATDFLRRLRFRPLMSVGDDGRPEFRFDTGVAARDLMTVLQDTFDILGELAATRPAVLVIDEFQAIMDIDSDLPSVLKGLLDDYPQVSLVAAGSKKHLMEGLFVDRGAPLFNMAERISIGPIPDPQMVDFIVRRADSAGKVFAEKAAQRVVALARPVPDDIQHLAWAAFEDSRGDCAISEANVDAAMATIVERQAHLYGDLFAQLSAAQRCVAAQLAVLPTAHPNSREFVGRTGLANNTSVRKGLEPLIENQLVERRETGYFVADPFWAAWLRQRTLD